MVVQRRNDGLVTSGEQLQYCCLWPKIAFVQEPAWTIPRGLLADSAAHRRDPHRTRLIEPAVQRALGQSRLIRKRFAVNHDRR